MVRIVKSEWHQVEKRDSIELSKELLEEIYPDYKTKEINQLYRDLISGNLDIADIINDAYNQGVDVDWDHDYDDWWTDRKGGYEVTYALEK